MIKFLLTTALAVSIVSGDDLATRHSGLPKSCPERGPFHRRVAGSSPRFRALFDGKKMKRCSKCGRKLSPREYTKDQTKPDGLYSSCRECRSKYASNYYLTNRITVNNRHRKYYQSHKTEVLQCHRKYEKTHKEETAKRHKKWRRANPGKGRAARHRHKARKNSGIVEKFSDREIFERDCWICGICGKRVGKTLKHPHSRSASLDHIIPIVDGGDHTRKNVQLAHLRCNLSKQARRGHQLRLIS